MSMVFLSLRGCLKSPEMSIVDGCRAPSGSSRSLKSSEINNANLHMDTFSCSHGDFSNSLLERGMPIEQMQKFLGHSKLETTQVYAESSTAMMRESYQRALSR